MSINQITTANTFGQLITAVAALIAVANNFTDGPQSQTNSTWTFTNANVGVNVTGTALASTANIGILNVSNANVTNETVGRSNISTANVTVANVVGATITNLISTDHLSANVNVSVLLQVSDRANIFSANIQTANIGALAVTTLAVTELTVPVLNASFANITTLSVTGTSQHNALVATLITTTNANVGLLNASTANISNCTMVTANASFANLTVATIGTLTITTETIGTGTFGVLNASFANITNETVGTMNVSAANTTTLFSNTSNIVSLNVASANIIRANMSADPTVNLEISTKHYADTGAGGNVVWKNTFTAKGDLPVGTGVNTFSVITSGVNGQSLIVDTQTASGLRWANSAPSQSFRNLWLSTSVTDKIANGTQIVIQHVDEVTMDDGELIRGWTDRSVVDITASGAGGLDTGSVLANTWYELYAIRKRSDGTKNFIFHRALDRYVGQNTANTVAWTIGTYASIAANSTVAGANARLAQSFTPNVAGPLTSVEIYGFRTLLPTGNVWLTLEANTAGSPSGTTLATSRKYDVARVGITTRYAMRFVFDTTANVAAANSYFWVLNTEYAGNATNFMNLTYSTTASTGQGGTNVGVPMGNTIGGVWTNLTPGIGTFIYKAFVEANSTSVTMPAEYDQKCLISYTATDPNSKIREYRQRDRTMHMPFSNNWTSYATLQITTPEVADVVATVPPVVCEVTFLGWQPSGVTQYLGLGTLNCLELPGNGYTQSGSFGGFTPGTSASQGNISQTPCPPVVVEQQAQNMHAGVAVTFIYVQSITF